MGCIYDTRYICTQPHHWVKWWVPEDLLVATSGGLLRWGVSCGVDEGWDGMGWMRDVVGVVRGWVCGVRV